MQQKILFTKVFKAASLTEIVDMAKSADVDMDFSVIDKKQLLAAWMACMANLRSLLGAPAVLIPGFDDQNILPDGFKDAVDTFSSLEMLAEVVKATSKAVMAKHSQMLGSTRQEDLVSYWSSLAALQGTIEAIVESNHDFCKDAVAKIKVWVVEALKTEATTAEDSVTKHLHEVTVGDKPGFLPLEEADLKVLAMTPKLSYETAVSMLTALGKPEDATKLQARGLIQECRNVGAISTLHTAGPRYLEYRGT